MTQSSADRRRRALSRRLRRRRRAARSARTSRLASHEVVAAAVARHAHAKRLQVLVDAESECVRLDLDLRLDLPPLAIHAQAPVVVSHTRCSFTDHMDQAEPWRCNVGAAKESGSCVCGPSAGDAIMAPPRLTCVSDGERTRTCSTRYW